MVKLLLIIPILAISFAAPHSTERSKTSLGLYVALQSSGIIRLNFDPTTDVNHSLTTIGQVTEAGDRPGWLTSHGDKLYSISRSHFPENSSVSAGVFAFQQPTAKVSDQSDLILLDSASTHGLGGVHVGVNPNGTILSAANIYGSSVSTYSLNPDGKIGALSNVFHYNLTRPGPGANDSQITSNPHEAIFDPLGRIMVVPDRGADRIYVYSVGISSIIQISNITLPSGSGPRHVTFRQIDSRKSYMYLVSELDNTIRVFVIQYPKQTSDFSCQDCYAPTIQLRQTISTLGAKLSRTKPKNHDLAAEVAASNDGKYLYASNRNALTLDSDTIAIYSINDTALSNAAEASEASHLTYLGHNNTLGKFPRDFALSPDMDNKWLAVTNQVTQDIHVFERDAQTGFLNKLVGRLALGSGLDLQQASGPMCVLWK